MKKIRNKIIILSILIALIAIGAIVYNSQSIKGIISSSEQLINAICINEKESISNFAAGDILYKLHNQKNSTTAEVENITTYIEKFNKNYAKVNCRVDLLLADGTHDVSWYDIELINKDGWKVYNLQPSAPLYTSDSFFPNNSDVFEHVLSEFIKNPKEYKKYTAGQVRQGLEIDNSGLSFSIKNLFMNNLYSDNKLVKNDVSYVVEDRQVDNIITFYKTKEGWKIVDIQSSFIK